MRCCFLRRDAFLATALTLFGILGLCGCRGESIARTTRSFPAGTGFVRQEFNIDGTAHTLWVFIPKDYNANQPRPAIVFLHGLFEAGNGNTENCLSAGIGPVIAKAPEDWPFITIFPQSDGTWRGEEREHLVIGALDFAESRWAIDRDRVILAGLSYGALGTWEIGARYPDRFAALVPVSGHRATDLVERLTALPVWAFSMRGDPFVASASSEAMCEQISEHGGNARLTEFSGIGHDCWDRAVANSDLVVWMLEQHRAHGTPASVAAHPAVAKVE